MPLWERVRKGVYVGCGISTTFFVERFLRKCRYEDFDWKSGMSIDDILQGSHQVQAPDGYFLDALEIDCCFRWVRFDSLAGE